MKMKTIYVSVITVVLTILSTIRFSYQLPYSDDSARFQYTKSGGQVHDNFYRIIESQPPVKVALNEALTWDVQAQYEHFELLQEHINKNDQYADYSEKVIAEAQDLLKDTLNKLQIHHEIDIRDYVRAVYDFEARRPISEEMETVIDRINEYRNAVVKQLEAAQDKARAEAEAKAQQAEAEAQDQAHAQQVDTDPTETLDANEVEDQSFEDGELTDDDDEPDYIEQPISAIPKVFS